MHLIVSAEKAHFVAVAACWLHCTMLREKGIPTYVCSSSKSASHLPTFGSY